MAGIGIGLALPFYQFLGAQGGGEIGPPDFIESDAAVWLKADAGVTLNGSNVSAWADQTANGNDAVNASASTQPLFSASVAALNGKPAVTIDAANKFLDTGSYNQGNLPTEAEFFSVGTKPSASIAANSFVFGGLLASNRGDLFYTVLGNDVRIAFFSAVSISPTQGLAPDGSAGITNVNGDGSGSNMSYLDAGGEITSTAGALGQQMGKLRVGDFNGSNGALVDTAEIIIFPRKLTATERDQVMVYLSGKYGIPYTPDDPPDLFWDDNLVWNDGDLWSD